MNKEDNNTLAEINQRIKDEALELIKYKSNMKSLYASYLNKRLFIMGDGQFIVERAGVKIIETTHTHVAIETFRNG